MTTSTLSSADSNQSGSPSVDSNQGGEDSHDTEGRLAALEKKTGRMRLSLKLKLAITLFLIIGSVAHMAFVYNAASSLSLEDTTLSGFTQGAEVGTFIVTVELTFDNPTFTSIDIDRLAYEIYVEDDYLGEGEKGEFSIKSGTQDHLFSLIIDLDDLSGPVLTLITQDTATLRIEGDVTIPVKAFGLFRWKTLTLPFDLEEEVSTSVTGRGDDIAPVPVILQPPVYNVLEGVIELLWSPNADMDFDRYEVHMSTEQGFTPSTSTLEETIPDRGTTDTSITPSGHLQTYYFKIRVVDEQGLTSDSNEVFILYP
ncbi:MAG: LEA type 2 family protein [Thermoplasmata archaeon]|nr:LEA type 2 family protein [Thermoplasmata archaeon]